MSSDVNAASGKQPSSSGLSQAFLSWGWCTFIFAIPALAILYIKHLLAQHIGLAKAAACCAWQIDAAQMDDWQNLVPWWAVLSIYREDLVFIAIIVPLFVLALMAMLPQRWRVPCLAVVSVLLFVGLFVEVRVFWMTGRFLSWGMAKEATSFATKTTGASDYIGGGFIMKLLGGFIFIVLLGFWAKWNERRICQGTRGKRIGTFLLAVGYVSLLVVTGVSWIPQACSNGCNRGVVALVLRSLCEDEVGPGEYANLSSAQLIQTYRRLTGAPEPQKHPDFWAQADGCDIILFVLETAPVRCLETSGDLREFPNLARLCDQALIGKEHYTTAAWSRHAHFSILTSWYPSGSLNDFPRRYPNGEFPGLMQSLKTAGYATAIYGCDPYTRDADHAMHAKLGIDRRIYPADGAPVPGPGKGSEALLQRIENDRAIFRKMKQDIACWHSEKRRFAAMFAPQIGHGPWLDVKGDIPATDMVGRGRAIIALQDAWLGELLKQLEEAGRLKNTLIVVTGDHGVRATAEDPRSFETGVIQEYSFHVPLVLYAPTALTARHEIPWTTSHIDLTPTLLDLVGVHQGRASEQGAPLWDRRLADRTIFFTGRIHVGADGYKSSSGCGMWNPLFDKVYAAENLAFNRNRPLLPSEENYAAVKLRLQQMTALQEAWANSFIDRP